MYIYIYRERDIYMHTVIHIHIHIYIYIERERDVNNTVEWNIHLVIVLTGGAESGEVADPLNTHLSI